MARRNEPNEPERILALYSRGPHFVRMLKWLRAEYPSETLIAAVPRDYRYDPIEAIADEILRLPAEGEGGTVSRALRIARALRRARGAHLVIMFDSPRLNLLARLCGARVLWCFSADGRATRLNAGLARVLFGALLARLRGELAWRRAKWGTARRYRERH